ncbi:MAG: SpoIIE family protein phosphatase [Bdellovibrionales bacterium]|nr:SpoIIE family protein phosphatase [Bdellovibrionales bacterium]
MIKISVLSETAAEEKALARELSAICPSGVEVNSFQTEPEVGAIVLVDGTSDGVRISDSVKKRVDQLDRRGRAIYLAVNEKLQSTPLLESGWVDDVLVFPFRRLELRSRLKTLQQILMWEEVHHLNASVSQAIEGLKEDLKLAERLQKRRLPVRFAARGFQIQNRYFAGMKSGGDFFDLAESSDQMSLNLVMTDASSYGLSSAVLAVLARLASRLTLEDKNSSSRTIATIHQDLVATLSEKDHLSLFFGRLDKRKMELSYCSYGSIGVFHAERGKPWKRLGSSGTALKLSSQGLSGQKDELVHLEPGDRFLLLSDGFSDAVGGDSAIEAFLATQTEKDGAELLNEFTYQLKKKLPSDDPESEPMPDQDCSALWLEVEGKTIRLARK